MRQNRSSKSWHWLAAVLALIGAPAAFADPYTITVSGPVEFAYGFTANPGDTAEITLAVDDSLGSISYLNDASTTGYSEVGNTTSPFMLSATATFDGNVYSSSDFPSDGLVSMTQSSYAGPEAAQFISGSDQSGLQINLTQYDATFNYGYVAAVRLNDTADQSGYVAPGALPSVPNPEPTDVGLFEVLTPSFDGILEFAIYAVQVDPLTSGPIVDPNGGISISINPPSTQVPEPIGVALLGLGLLGAAAARRKGSPTLA